MDHYLPLNRAALLFFPSVNSVVQVIIMTPRYAFILYPRPLLKTCSINVGLLATFYLAQHDITVRLCLSLHHTAHTPQKAIESLVLAQIHAPLPPTVVLAGHGYSLRSSKSHLPPTYIYAPLTLPAERVPWAYGRGLRLAWGAAALAPGADKWVFELALDPAI